jgi:hypothetical protein
VPRVHHDEGPIEDLLQRVGGSGRTAGFAASLDSSRSSTLAFIAADNLRYPSRVFGRRLPPTRSGAVWNSIAASLAKRPQSFCGWRLAVFPHAKCAAHTGPSRVFRSERGSHFRHSILIHRLRRTNSSPMLILWGVSWRPNRSGATSRWSFRLIARCLVWGLRPPGRRASLGVQADQAWP